MNVVVNWLIIPVTSDWITPPVSHHT